MFIDNVGNKITAKLVKNIEDENIQSTANFSPENPFFLY